MKAKVLVYRGKYIESSHDIDFIIFKDNKILAKSASIDSAFFPRSSIKLLQAFDFVLSGAYEKSKTTKKELALACASHNSEPRQVKTVLAWLKKNNLKENHLVCGPNKPRREEDFISFIKNGEKATKAYNNCSGKHSAMLINSQHLGYSLKDYAKHNSKIQKRFIHNIEELCNEKIDTKLYAIDGCGLPNYQMTLKQLVKAMAAFNKISNTDTKEGRAAKYIIEAIKTYPQMVAGKDRLCSEITEASNGRILAKVGAEGVYTAITQDNHNIALKVKDGSFRAVEPALAGLLNHFGILNKEERRKLKDWIKKPLYNTLKNNTGWIETKVYD